MAYELAFPADRQKAFEALDSEATSEVYSKLESIVDNEWRSPTDQHWDFHSVTGAVDGKYKIGSYRVFVDVNDECETITVREARHRENLYRG